MNFWGAPEGSRNKIRGRGPLHSSLTGSGGGPVTKWSKLKETGIFK